MIGKVDSKSLTCLTSSPGSPSACKYSVTYDLELLCMEGEPVAICFGTFVFHANVKCCGLCIH